MLKEDIRVNKITFPKLLLYIITLNPFCLIILYRLSSWLQSKGIKVLPTMIRSLGIAIFSADISPYAKIGGGLRIAHTVGIVIGSDVVIGKNAHIFHNITLGSGNETKNGRTMPTIGDNVSLFAGSVVVGPVKIGDNVSIGANAVVTKSFPNNVVVGGVPGRVIGTIEIANSLKCM